MSAATATDAAPPKKGSKKLILIIAGAVAVLALGGGGAIFMMKKKAADAAAAEAEAEEDDGAKPAKAAKAAAKSDPKAAPVFVPLDMFTVNLADKEAERYAQIGITLEIDDAKLGDQIKNYMPAIRNNILMAIADKTAAQLTDREGKLQLALEVRRETSRALGHEPAAPEAPADGDEKPKKTSKKKKADPDAELPIKAVHFSNFIIQ